ncbi:hypothetical protein D3C71_1656600 [compost metagenome]
MKLHTRVPLSNRPDSSDEADPMLPVRLIDGKNAARAAPMLALAASSVCSACSTSGRRSSTSDGKPDGNAPTLATSVTSACGSSEASIGPPASSTSALRSCATCPANRATSVRAVSTRVRVWLSSSAEAPPS